MDIWRPFTQMKTCQPPLKIKSARAASLYTPEGKEIVDALSSWWVITHGHCQPEIVQAVQDQANNLDQVLFANFDHEPAQLLAQKLGEVLPANLNKMFFSDNGSTAVEVGLKTLLQYWRQKGDGQRKTFLSFSHSYHGDTVGAMSVSGDSLFTEPYKDMLFQVYKVEQGRLSTQKWEEYFSPFEEVFLKHNSCLAGVIIEPLIQGAGGMITWPKRALEEIHKLCVKFDVPLIFDEVMTGFGRTGTLFAFEQLSFTPDVLCLSKGLTGGFLPLSLTITGAEIYSAFLSDEKSKMLFHGHSFTGNPLSCAAASANLDLIIQGEGPLQWKRIEDINRLRSEKFLNHSKCKDMRLCGTMAALEIHSDQHGYSSQISDRFKNFALEQGVFLRPLGDVVYLLPPYSITNEQLNKVWDVIEEGVEELI